MSKKLKPMGRLFVSSNLLCKNFKNFPINQTKIPAAINERGKVFLSKLLKNNEVALVTKNDKAAPIKNE